MDEHIAKNIRAIAGRIPENAVTDWLKASALAALPLPSGHLIQTSHNATTNLAWAQEEIRKHNRLRPATPFYLHTSCKNPDYICICKKGSTPNEKKA